MHALTRALSHTLALSLLTALPAVALPDQPALVSSGFVFEEAPFPGCHASTIVETAPGQMLAAWFGGTAEGKADVGVWTAHLSENTWSKPVEVANGIQPDGNRFPCWNPVLFRPKDGPLMLFYKVGPSPTRWWGMVRTSTNGGKTWSDARRLPEGIAGPIKNKPIQLPDGSLLSGSSDEGLQNGPSWQIHFEHGSADGSGWKRIEVPQPPGSPNAIQPSILQHTDGRLQALGRTREGHLFSTFSTDQGKSWQTPALLQLPNPNSGTDAITLKDGRHLLIYNHTAKGRSPLNLAISRNGTDWEAALVLEEEAGKEFSYPAIIQAADGSVHATYTWKRKRIKHAVIDPARIQPRPFENGAWPQ
jgi:predicted neuraminidase